MARMLHCYSILLCHSDARYLKNSTLILQVLSVIRCEKTTILHINELAGQGPILGEVDFCRNFSFYETMIPSLYLQPKPGTDPTFDG